MRCERCRAETATYTGSYFDTAFICPACEEREKAHPAFAEAKRVEEEHVMRGETNFPGVGLPKDGWAKGV